VARRPVNFVRVTWRNESRHRELAAWGVGLRYSGGRPLPAGRRTFRFLRPVVPPGEGLYTQPGAPFDAGSVWAFKGGAVTRDGEALLILAPTTRGISRRLILRPGGTSVPVSESTVFGRADYRARLAPGAERHLDFVMPVVPTSPGSHAYTTIAHAEFGRELARVVRYWRRAYAGAVQIHLPEAKVEQSFYTSLANMELPRYRAATGGWVQAVNKLQYNAFWLRDGAIIANAFDLAGLHGLAAQDLEFFRTWQQPDGLFISRPQQYDGFGEALWAIGEHAARTQDRAFARGMLEPVERALDWFEHASATDPLGLMPASTPGDDELTSGHITGDNFWAADGIRAAIGLATLLGRHDLAARWRGELHPFLTDLRARLTHAEASSGGAIPPALEANGGEDWGNLWAAYPGPVIAPGDPAVTATLRHVRSHFREGIATYYQGTLLHDYLGFRVFETELLRGEQRAVVAGLYAELAHTTATDGGFELGIRKGGRREVDQDLAPHGTFAAEYVSLVRNMLVREDGRSLVLMSAVSPRWLLPGQRIVVRGADTTRGRIGYTLRTLRRGAVLSWRGSLRPGTTLRWPVPDAARDVSARGLSRRTGTITLRGSTGSLRIRWRLAGPFPSFSATARRVIARY